MFTMRPPSAISGSRRFEVHRVDLVELRRGGLDDARVQRHARVVDEVVELLAVPGPLELGCDRFAERVERAAVGNVELQRDGLASERAQATEHFVRFAGRGAVREDDVGAALGQVKGHAAAEAAAAAGDESDGSRHGRCPFVVRLLQTIGT